MLQIPGRVILTAGALALACGNPPTAIEEPDAGAISLGRANDNGATFWLPGLSLPCAVIDGTGALVPRPCTMQIATPSSNSNAMVVVRASGIFNPTGRTVHWGPDNPGWGFEFIWSLPPFQLTAPPYPCGVKVGPGDGYLEGVLFTLNWHATVTPDGDATVTCHYSDKSAWMPLGPAAP